MNHQCLTVLKNTLQCSAPLEGCALLLGLVDERNAVHLNHVWPCCNVWHPPAARDKRFALDPREQLAAQRWSRVRGERVIGVAHGHPRTDAFPSIHDCRLGLVDSLMVIGGVDGGLRAWWLNADRTVRVVPISVQDTH